MLLDRLAAFGERRADRRLAKATMHVVAALRSPKAGPVRLQEFLLPSLGDEPRDAESAADEVRRFDQAGGAKWAT